MPYYIEREDEETGTPIYRYIHAHEPRDDPSSMLCAMLILLLTVWYIIYGAFRF